MSDGKLPIRALLFLGATAICGILAIQVYWVRTSIAKHNADLKLLQADDSLNRREFYERVNVALYNVADEIKRINRDPSDSYGVVKQSTSNHFVVDINDTLHPFILQNLLKREFLRSNIRQDFQYGIYDCFTDSIVYGDYVSFSKDSLYEVLPEVEEPVSDVDKPSRYENDGHYFSVIFPQLKSAPLRELAETATPWFFVFAILILVFAMFGYLLNVILRQRKLSAIKNDFINNMTHELKTPISTISISSENLLNGNPKEDPERFTRYSAIIYKENKRLEKQVERVLNVAKLDKHEVNFKKEPVDLVDVIEQACATFNIECEEGEEMVTFDNQATDTVVTGDELHLLNVFNNLLDNASKYCKREPRIHITACNKDNGIAIEVKDNGIGMKKDQLKQIFEKFYRVPTGNLHDVKGFGLGLYYVKTVVEQHRGYITVNSQTGKGSTFYIWLPH